MSDNTAPRNVLISSEQFLEHWLGHRALTRRVIEAFPEDKLFSFSVGGMRPFSELAWEFIRMAVPGIRGAATGQWTMETADAPTNKAELLARWDAATVAMKELWPTIPATRFQEQDVAYGQWPGLVYTVLTYAVDNEIHHRGQGYVYLRALGIEPPAFYER